MEKENKMGTMAIPKLVANMSIPLMLSLLVQSLYNIVDGIFVAKLSEDALTATSLAYPVQIFMLAMAVGTSVGVNALLSRTLGSGNKEEAGQVAVTGLLLAFAGGLLFTVIGILFAPSLASLFTERQNIAAMCGEYLSVCMAFCLGTFMETMFQRLLQASGNTFASMISLIVGAGTNLVLDPIMIFGMLGCPAMGVRGAAVATVIGQWAGAAVAALLNRRKNRDLPLSLKKWRYNGRMVAGIYKVGAPTVLTHAVGSFMVSAVNMILMPITSSAVAFFGAYYKLQNFLFMPMNGLGQAAIPIVGYNLGAGKKDRIRGTFRTVIPAAAVIAAIAVVVFECFPGELLGLFSAEGEMLAIGIPALRIIAAVFPFAAVTIVLGYCVSGLGSGITNMVAALLRQFIVLIPAMALLVGQFGIGAAWFALWASEGCAFAYSVISARRKYRQKVKN